MGVMSFVEFIQAHHAQNIVYLVLLVGMFTDAALVIFIAIFLMAQRALNIPATIGIIIVGTLLEQLLWYWIGSRLGKFNGLVRWTDRLAQPFDRHILEKPFRTLVISKFVYGLHRAVLARAGMLGLHFKTYVRDSFLSTFIWLAALGGIGYGFSASYSALSRYMNYAEIIPLVLVIIYFIVDYYISKRLKKTL